MAKQNKLSEPELPLDLEVEEVEELEDEEEVEAVEEEEAVEEAPAPATDPQDIDEILNSLKTLLGTVEKLQKVRQDVGDIKPLLVRMLDGELVSGEELEQLKVGVGGLLRLVKAHGDHQTALAKAQSARQLLDEVLKFQPSQSS
jgi:hypothetical protein